MSQNCNLCDRMILLLELEFRITVTACSFTGNICTIKLLNVGGNPDPEKVFKASQVEQAIKSVKSVLFSPQLTTDSCRDDPTSNGTHSSTPINTVSLTVMV